MRSDPSSSPTPPSGPIDALAEYKIRASKLLKDFASDDKRRAFGAAYRLASLWPDGNANDLLADKSRVQRKHALAVIAREMGFRDWQHLTEEAHIELPAFDTSRLFSEKAGFYLNAWFVTYEEAKAALTRKDRFLFPFRHQFVVCEAGLLKSLGIDTNDPDWEAIGHDWVKPLDTQAHYRLNQKLVRIVPPLPERRRARKK
ncbi:conserved hypothetical protein [Parvibaculum lavamentivorans DS-1]|uniref:Uncharacterized protein n=1 Tax=Parvibaculum lavamentivorans (strain DS-1 / DSM 13023 / NCIMB 13966) TaxID=402881 RepID=A7HP24_PARL1|nr:hypothetical protein [Parvibaculum lavamentivorans]ABS61657.1 conserved hypothetical protein [Parvibaculum lavamentivorans DS-1]